MALTEKQKERRRKHYAKHREEILRYQQEYFKNWYPSHKEKVLQSSRRWRATNPGRQVLATKEWRKKHKDSPTFKSKQKKMRDKWISANPSKVREYNLKRKYKLTPEQYEEILKKQEGKCANIYCKKEDMIIKGSKGSRRLAIDHDHETGKIRGLLCRDCNLILGFCKDNQQLLEGLIRYLGENK